MKPSFNPRSRLPSRTLAGVAALVFLCAIATIARAQPAYINYQGRLNDAAGQPLPTGNYTLEFSIFDDPTDTDPNRRVWGPFRFDGAVGPGHGAEVSVINGRFNVILGPVDTGNRSIRDAFDGDNRFLEISVDGGAPILPRQQFLSTPYSFKAQGITGSLDISGNLAIDGDLTIAGQISGQVRSVVDGTEFYMVPRGAIVMWSGSPTALPPGWALCDGSNNTPDLRNRFVFGYDPGTPEVPILETGGTTNHTHDVNIPSFTSGGTGSSGTLGYVAILRDDNISAGHSHSVNPPNTTSTSTPHIPPYIRLGFIMKL